MKVHALAMVAIAFIITSLPTPALGEYHPTLGRFMQRDPLGYVDGGNLYAGYFVMWGGVDPEGTRLVLVEVAPNDGRGDHAPQYVPNPIYDEVLRRYNKIIDNAIRVVEGIPNEAFDRAATAGRVMWGDEVFRGRKVEYVERLEREKTSVALMQNYGTLEDAIRKLKELAGDDVRSYDHIAFGIHGVASDLGDYNEGGDTVRPATFTRDITVHGRRVDRAESVRSATEAFQEVRASFVIGACGQRGYFERLSIGSDGYQWSVRGVDGERVWSVRFHPVRTKVEYLRTMDPRDVPVDPETGEPITSEDDDE